MWFFSTSKVAEDTLAQSQGRRGILLFATCLSPSADWPLSLPLDRLSL